MYYVYGSFMHGRNITLFDNEEKAWGFLIACLNEEKFNFKESQIREDFSAFRDAIIPDKNDSSIYMEIKEIEFGDISYL